jgi:hypothetical protein
MAAPRAVARRDGHRHGYGREPSPVLWTADCKSALFGEILMRWLSPFVGQLTGKGARGLKKCPDEVGTRRTGSFGETGRAWTARPDPFRAAPRTGATRPDPFRATRRVEVPRPDPFRARPRTGAARPNPFRARSRTGAARPNPFRATPKGGGAAAEANPGETSRSIPVDKPVGGSAIEAGRLAPRDSARRDASGRGVRRSSGRRLRGRQAAWLADMGGGRAGRLDRGRSGQRDERKAARPRAFWGF